MKSKASGSCEKLRISSKERSPSSTVGEIVELVAANSSNKSSPLSAGKLKSSGGCGCWKARAKSSISELVVGDGVDCGISPKISPEAAAANKLSSKAFATSCSNSESNSDCCSAAVV